MKKQRLHTKVSKHLIKERWKKKAKTSKSLLLLRGRQENHYLARVHSRQSWFLSRNVLASRQVNAQATSKTSCLRIKRQAKAKDISNPNMASYNNQGLIRNGKKFTIRLTIQVSLEIATPLSDNLSDIMREILLPLPTPSTTHKSNRSIQIRILKSLR